MGAVGQVHTVIVRSPSGRDVDAEGRWSDVMVPVAVRGRVEVAGVANATDVLGGVRGADGVVWTGQATLPLGTPVVPASTIEVFGSGPADGVWDVDGVQPTRLHLRVALSRRVLV